MRWLAHKIIVYITDANMQISALACAYLRRRTNSCERVFAHADVLGRIAHDLMKNSLLEEMSTTTGIEGLYYSCNLDAYWAGGVSVGIYYMHFFLGIS